MDEYDLCPVCGKQWLERDWSPDTFDGMPVECYEECHYCGYECETDMLTGEETVMFYPPHYE